MTTDVAIDVAVLGGGACGMMAALQAARNRWLTIAVFEKSSQQGCNAGISSGSLAAAGTRFQAEHGVVDSPEMHVDDILRVSNDPTARPLVSALCNAAPQYVEWLADAIGYPIILGNDMYRSGHSAIRLHTDAGRRGGAFLVSQLRKAVSRHPNILFADNTPGIGLVEEAGCVVGVNVLEASGPISVSAPAVVLATDGFAANATMMRKYCPGVAGAHYGGVSTSTGDGIQWGQDLGAETRNMGSYLGHGLVVLGHGTRIDPAIPFLGALIIGADGERFIDETSVGYSQLANCIAEREDQRAVVLWDEQAMKVVEGSPAMRESKASGAYRRYSDLQSLSDGVGISKDVLERVLRTAAPSPRAGLASPQQLSFPLYAAWVGPAVLTTQGGLVVDVMGRVKRSEEEVVPGLFAGGGSAVGISGPSSEGYSSGNGLLSALGLGWIIGRHLSERDL